MYLNSAPMVAGLRSALAARGVDVAAAVANGALVVSSEQSHLVEGWFDPATMLQMLEQAVNEARREGYAGLWATGDVAWEFGGESDFSKLLEYEYGLEALFQVLPGLSGVCQYHRDVLPESAIVAALAGHRAAYVNNIETRINPYFQPMRAAMLPRKVSPATIQEMLKSLEHAATA